MEPIIAGFYGLDGVGKTQLARAAAKEVGGVFVMDEFPLPPASAEQEVIVNSSSDAEAHFKFYNRVAMFYMQRARAVTALGKHAFLDLTAIQVIAEHQAWRTHSALRLSLHDRSLVQPGVNIFVDCSEEDRQNRIEERCRRINKSRFALAQGAMEEHNIERAAERVKITEMGLKSKQRQRLLRGHERLREPDYEPYNRTYWQLAMDVHAEKLRSVYRSLGHPAVSTSRPFKHSLSDTLRVLDLG